MMVCNFIQKKKIIFIIFNLKYNKKNKIIFSKKKNIKKNNMKNIIKHYNK